MANHVETPSNVSKPIIALPTIPKPNPILFALDNEKKRPVLAHEYGNGSPCNTCKQTCPGLDLHYWRKICKNCKCSKDDHDVLPPSTDPGKLRIGKLFDKKDDVSQQIDGAIANCLLNDSSPRNVLERKIKFDWVPPNTTQAMVDKFMAQLPEQNRPVTDTEGALKRRQALERQVPLHDIDASACDRSLNEDEARCMRKFVDFAKREALGQGRIGHPTPAPDAPIEKALAVLRAWKCRKCNVEMCDTEIAVFADRAGPETCWHPQCFTCTECSELLADLIYFYKNDEIYCGRHFGNLLFPRCAGCDELIFAKEYTEAESRPWHLEHFCCYMCDVHLGGQRYMVKKDQPYCLACYERYFARTCEFCRQKILNDQHRISHEKFHWHARDECFFCCCCKVSLLKQRYVLKNGKIFCSIECKNKISG